MADALKQLPDSAKPTQFFGVKMVVGGIVSVLGMYYLAIGKKEADAQKMLLGAALILASVFLF